MNILDALKSNLAHMHRRMSASSHMYYTYYLGISDLRFSTSTAKGVHATLGLGDNTVPLVGLHLARKRKVRVCPISEDGVAWLLQENGLACKKKDSPVCHCISAVNEPYLRPMKTFHGMKLRRSTIQGTVQRNICDVTFVDSS